MEEVDAAPQTPSAFPLDFASMAAPSAILTRRSESGPVPLDDAPEVRLGSLADGRIPLEAGPTAAKTIAEDVSAPQ